MMKAIRHQLIRVEISAWIRMEVKRGEGNIENDQVQIETRDEENNES